MKRSAIRLLISMIIILLFMCGCSKGNALYGDWQLDRVEAIADSDGSDTASLSAREYGAENWAITVNEDGTAYFRIPVSGRDSSIPMHWTDDDGQLLFVFDDNELYDFDLSGALDKGELVIDMLDVFRLYYKK
ncbi:MAG: hypothetical protein IKF68_05675 [Erysipelotrichaceae bacterium]|nr:hypothetical protein [Erysipelotrichaceae bacterium]